MVRNERLSNITPRHKYKVEEQPSFLMVFYISHLCFVISVKEEVKKTIKVLFTKHKEITKIEDVDIV